MCLVIYAWLVQQDYFKELTDQDVRKRIYEDQRDQIEQDMSPFGFIVDGRDDESFVIVLTWWDYRMVKKRGVDGILL